MEIPFNKPFIIGKELYYIAQAVLNGKLSGNGTYTKKCQEFLEQSNGIARVLMTHSCTSALEMTALLSAIGSDDEVILPSFTYVSTANAFALRGAKLRFVDIKEETLNMDEALAEEAVTRRTKVICPVHYAGIPCDLDRIMALAEKHQLWVVEDAAQGLMSRYKGRPLGSVGHLAAYSFHETKNVNCGEGGALLINDRRFLERAEIIWEKGTDRSKFFRGETDRYTWIDLGSSFYPSELVTAFLFAQLEHAADITHRRVESWWYYHNSLSRLQERGILRLPVIPEYCTHNGHLFYLLLNEQNERDNLMSYLKERGVLSIFHYIPLHSSPMGRRLGYDTCNLPVTERVSSTLLRLPLYYEISRLDQDTVIRLIYEYFGERKTCV